MTAQSSVSQTVVTQVCALFRTRHEGRIPVLALLVLGLACVSSIRLLTVAEAVVAQGYPAQAVSVETKFRRWLRNRRVTPEAIWQEITPSLLASWAGRELTLVFDGTPHGTHWTVLTIGAVSGDRVLPLAGIVKPQQTPWGESTADAIRPACTRIAAAVPDGVPVTFLADQGLTGPDLIDLCQTLGWHYTLRVNASAAPMMRVRTRDGQERAIAELLPTHSRRTSKRVVIEAAIYRGAGWRWGWLTISWGRDYPEPWVLISDRPGGSARVRAYKQRVRIEATFQDLKRRGWNLEASHLRQADRIERLLVALYLTYWWMHTLGRRVIRAGGRRGFDRGIRRTCSVVKLGIASCRERLHANRLRGWFTLHPPQPRIHPILARSDGPD